MSSEGTATEEMPVSSLIVCNSIGYSRLVLPNAASQSLDGAQGSAPVTHAVCPGRLDCSKYERQFEHARTEM